MLLELHVLKNFAIFTGTHLCWSLFRHRYFPVNIVKFSRAAFFIEQLWWLLLLAVVKQKLRRSCLTWIAFHF